MESLRQQRCSNSIFPSGDSLAHSSGKVSSEWPGMNHVALMLYFSNSLRRRRVPRVPAKRPREMSLVESSPPYYGTSQQAIRAWDVVRALTLPSQPATASMSTPYDTSTRFLPIVLSKKASKSDMVAIECCKPRELGHNVAAHKARAVSRFGTRAWNLGENMLPDADGHDKGGVSCSCSSRGKAHEKSGY